MNLKIFDTIIEKGILFLIIFTPLAFGSVEVWASAIMEITAFALFGAWLLRQAMQGRFAVTYSPIIILAGIFILLVVVQSIELPRSVVSLLSPGTIRIYDEFGTGAMRRWIPLSIHQQATREELFKLLAYFAVFIVVVHHLRSKEQVRTIVRAIVAMGLFLAVFAIVQKMTWNGRLYWFYPLGPGITSNRDYIWGPYLNHNHLAGYLEMAILLALGLLFYQISRKLSSRSSFNETRLPGSFRSEWFPRNAGLFVLIIIMIAILFATLSRGGIIGLTAGLAIFMLMIRTRRSLVGFAPVLFLLGIVVLLAVVAASWDRIESRFSEIGKEGRIKRFDVWTDAVSLVQAFPLLGTGFGTFGDAYPLYQTKNSTLRFEHAENDYLELLADTGFAGFSLLGSLGALFSVLAFKKWRKRRSMFVKCIGAGGLASCAAMGVHSLADFNMRIPANAMTFTVIAGMTWALLFNVRSDKAGEESSIKEKTGFADSDIQ
jgi:O-antigen ligase